VAHDERLTLRETALRFAARPSPFVGSPVTVANEIERWFREEAADGFNFRVSNPGSFNVFVEQVLPILRKRGLFRTEYEAETLRGHLGLPVPANRHSVARKEEPAESGATAVPKARASARQASA
jgi:hypothetical protein